MLHALGNLATGRATSDYTFALFPLCAENSFGFFQSYTTESLRFVKFKISSKVGALTIQFSIEMRLGASRPKTSKPKLCDRKKKGVTEQQARVTEKQKRVTKLHRSVLRASTHDKCPNLCPKWSPNM